MDLGLLGILRNGSLEVRGGDINPYVVYYCGGAYYGYLHLRRGKARNEGHKISCALDLIQKKNKKEARELKNERQNLISKKTILLLVKLIR